jgi:hypothetical protein
MGWVRSNARHWLFRIHSDVDQCGHTFVAKRRPPPWTSHTERRAHKNSDTPLKRERRLPAFALLSSMRSAIKSPRGIQDQCRLFAGHNIRGRQDVGAS